MQQQPFEKQTILMQYGSLCRLWLIKSLLVADSGDYQVIGGGVVGLAIARQLASRHGTSTLLIERNEAVGMETSSRNSEVIS